MIVVVPPRLAPIAPIQLSLDDNAPPQRAVFTCRVLRGSAESLNLEWILTDGTPVQVGRETSSRPRSHRSSSRSMESPLTFLSWP